jgi:hypothetical protein
LRRAHPGIVFNRHFDVEGAVVFKQACALGCEGIVSKRLGSPYRSGRADCWVKVKNSAAPAVKREAEEDWGDDSRVDLRAALAVALGAFLPLRGYQGHPEGISHQGRSY